MMAVRLGITRAGVSLGLHVSVRSLFDILLIVIFSSLCTGLIAEHQSPRVIVREKFQSINTLFRAFPGTPATAKHRLNDTTPK